MTGPARVPRAVRGVRFLWRHERARAAVVPGYERLDDEGQEFSSTPSKAGCLLCPIKASPVLLLSPSEIPLTVSAYCPPAQWELFTKTHTHRKMAIPVSVQE